MSELKNDAGNKYDGEKLRLDLISIPAILRLARIFTFGAIKYEARNYEKGLSFTRCFGAVLRHLFAWFLGQEIDKESGEPHLSCAVWEVMALLHYVETKTGTDDRPKYKDVDVYSLFDLEELIKLALEAKKKLKNRQ